MVGSTGGLTVGAYYGGFGGYDIGAKVAGLEVLFSVEWDPEIAAVARYNLGAHVMTADVISLEYAALPYVDLFHASPPCPNFSVAKVGGETMADMEHSHAIVMYLSHHRPRYFTLENVVQYRNSYSINIIKNALVRFGYHFRIDHICASRHGVDQLRNRLYIRASRDHEVAKMPRPPKGGCWYRSIADLVDGLEDTEFAQWQLDKLPSLSSWQIDRAFLAAGHGARNDKPFRFRGNPSQTVCGGPSLSSWRAFLVGGEHASSIRPICTGEPSFTLSASQKSSHRCKIPSGRIKKISPRCLARWQSFPDWYRLPKKRSLAGRGIGNAVPPKVAIAVINSLVRGRDG